MEESTKKSDALGGNVSECTVAESASEQTLGQAMGYSGQGFEGNVDDLMVEVLGSEVYVGGVCTSGTGENLEDSGPEMAENGGGLGELGSLVVSESVEEEQVCVVAGEAARNLESSCAVEGSVCVDIQVDAVSNTEVITREGVAEGETHETVSVEDQLEIEIQEVDTVGVPVSGSRIAEEDVEMESSELGGDRLALDNGKGTTVTNAATVEDSGEVTRAREENFAASSPLEEQGPGSNVETDVGESETLNGSDEKERVTSENSGGDAENRNTNPTSSCPPKVTVSEVVSVSEQAEKAGDKAQLESDNEEQVEADEVQVNCAELAGLNGGDKERAQSSDHLNEKGVTSEVSPVSGDKEDTFDRDQVSSHEEEQVEIGSQQDEDTHAVDESELPISSDFQAETASRTTGMDVEVGDYVDDMCPMDTDEVMISEMEVLEHPDTDQRVITEEYLGKVTASDGFGLHEERDSMPVEETIFNAETLEPSYELLPEHESELSLHDLVWGKVKSHPWWPGQIFDFTDASEKAMKHHKKDCLLVAYFGDRSFSWNEESTLKSFRAHFSEMVAQSNGETFHNAVDCALEEVSRRVELGLACSCTPKDFNENVRVQIVENSGIRPESNIREGLDESTGVNFFQPNKFVEYVRSLAQSSLGNTDALGLTVAKAQLLAFARSKGFGSLPEFQFCGDLVENDLKGEVKVYKSSNKRKHDLRDGVVHHKVKKEKSMSELMGDNAVDYPDEEHVSEKRRRSSERHHGDDLTLREARKTTTVTKALTPPKQSFKIGECMRRVASQMKGSATATNTAIAVTAWDEIGNGNEDDISLQNSEGVKAADPSEYSLEGVKAADPTEYSSLNSGGVIAADPTEYTSLNELLFQLHFLAQNPNKEYSFSNVIVNFFSDFRNSVIDGRHPSLAELLIPDKVGEKRKKMSPETFDFDDMSDAYWTDRVIQNGAEEQAQQAQDQAQPQEPQAQPQEPQVQPQPQQPSARKGRKKENTPEKTPKTKRPYNRKRFLNGAAATPTPQKLASEKPPGYVGPNAPTELAMIFTEVKSVPSESSLNKMFRRFGPLKEGETEIERESGRARVVFKKCSDAEVALNSAAKFSIFGAAVVNYELNYNPVVQYKPSPIVMTLDDHHHHEHDDIQIDIHDMHLDLSPHDHDMELDLFDVSLV